MNEVPQAVVLGHADFAGACINWLVGPKVLNGPPVAADAASMAAARYTRACNMVISPEDVIGSAMLNTLLATVLVLAVCGAALLLVRWAYGADARRARRLATKGICS